MNHTKCKAGKQPSPSSKTSVNQKKPALIVTFKHGKPKQYAPEHLDAEDWAELAQKCRAAGGQITLDARYLAVWSDESRYSLLRLVKSLDGQCRLKVKGKTYADPFEAVVSAMVPATNMSAHRQTLRAAIEAAALFHGDLSEQVAKRINDRLVEVGAAKINHLRLVKQIREVAGNTAGSAEMMSPEQAAQVFLEQARTEVDLPEHLPVVWYYQGSFHVWREGVWGCVKDSRLAAQIMRFLQGQNQPHVNERFVKDVIAHLKGITLLDCWNEPMPFLVKKEDPLTIQRPSLIVLRNGAIDLAKAVKANGTPRLTEVDSTYFNSAVLPYDFDAEAKCPLWQQTLKEILPVTGKGDKRRLVMQEFFGYTLWTNCQFQKLLVLLGEGGNGKSTITETWEAMLGEDNVADVALEKLGDDFRQAPLVGKLANFSGELPYLGKINEGLVKRIVSGEPIDANLKHKDPIRARITAKLIVNTNEMPQIRDSTQATWDRLIILPFEVRVRGTKKEDKSRGQKLKAELPGIFLWALMGLRRLIKQGGFTSCSKCDAVKGLHRVDSDSVLQFAQECCQANASKVIFSVPLYGVYKEWAERTGRKAVALSEFGKRLARAGWKKGREKIGKRRRVYLGRVISTAGEHYAKQWMKHGEWPEDDITTSKSDMFGGED